MFIECLADVFLDIFYFSGCFVERRKTVMYRPMSFPTTGVSFDSRYKPTSSHVSAPSKLPMVTSNSDFVSLLHHAVFPLKSNDFFALMMMFFSSSVILSYWEANTSACVKRSSDMDG